MEHLPKIVVFAHIIAANMFVMTLVIMQLVVNPAMAKIPAGPGKEAAVAFIQGRWHPVVDAAIITLDITGLFLLVTRLWIIGASPILHIKTSFGAVALICANLLHFYFRSHKRKLKAEGRMDRLARITRITSYMEKTALVTGVLAFLFGATFNHSPF